MKEEKKDYLEWERELLDYLKPVVIEKNYKLNKMVPVKLYGFNSLDRELQLPEIIFCKEIKKNQFDEHNLRTYFRRSELIRFYQQNFSFDFIGRYIVSAATTYNNFKIPSINNDSSIDIFFNRYSELYKEDLGLQKIQVQIDEIMERLNREILRRARRLRRG